MQLLEVRAVHATLVVDESELGCHGKYEKQGKKKRSRVFKLDKGILGIMGIITSLQSERVFLFILFNKGLFFSFQIIWRVISKYNNLEGVFLNMKDFEGICLKKPF